MVVEFARELAKGANVTVYCSNGGKRYTDVFEDVVVSYYDRIYREVDKHQGVLIAFKDVDAIILDGFDKRFIWTADPDVVRPTIRSRCDGLVALGPWHKQELKKLNIGFNRIYAIEPGIHIETSTAKRIPKQCLYASSPDRGLDFLESIWPEVLKAHPDATLISTYSKHKRVSTQEMVDLYHSSDILAYPCIGGERFCITAIKAQMYGTIPCVIPTMALQDTVQFGEKSLKKDYLNSMIHMLGDDNETTRKDMMNGVRYNTWSDAVEQWRNLIG